MKALLLAAGVGARLRPLTDRTPKCLVDVHGTPLLGIWFENLLRHGVDSVLINTHHLAAQVADYVKHHTPAGLHVTLTHEPTLLGSAGTLRANRAFVENEADYFILYADNLTNLDLTDLLAFHRARQSPLTIGLFRTPAPRECGIAELDGHGRIVEFVEKPAAPRSNLAGAGIYVGTPALLASIPDTPGADFGFDVIPRWAGKMFGYEIQAFFYDLGTPERLERARSEWPGLPLRNQRPERSQRMQS